MTFLKKSNVENKRLLVVDANIAMSIILGGQTNTTRNTFVKLLEAGVLLFIPDLCLVEVERNLPRAIEVKLLKQTTDSSIIQAALVQSLAAWQELQKLFQIVPLGEFQYLEKMARKRVGFDVDDWSYVALALHLDCAIWTKNVKHLAGGGVPVWATDRVMVYLEA
jgi:predicted nucleic acid-binding protein